MLLLQKCVPACGCACARGKVHINNLQSSYLLLVRALSLWACLRAGYLVAFKDALGTFHIHQQQHQPMDVEMCSINQAVNAVCRFHIINGRNVIRQRYGTQNILNSNGGSKDSDRNITFKGKFF